MQPAMDGWWWWTAHQCKERSPLGLKRPPEPVYDASLREAIGLRMSPSNRESVAVIARDTGITAQTDYNWPQPGAEAMTAGVCLDQATKAVERCRQAGGRDSGCRTERNRAVELLWTAKPPPDIGSFIRGLAHPSPVGRGASKMVPTPRVLYGTRAHLITGSKDAWAVWGSCRAR
jgi:hypothetical protein